MIGTALVGARLADVAANARYYGSNPAEVLAVWHGGLSSFGGLALAVPTALWLARLHLPGVPVLRLGDATVPALVATWAVGRLLACQFEVGGRGPPTTARYGLSYAGEVGRRVPVPLLQSAEDWVVYFVEGQVNRIGRQSQGHRRYRETRRWAPGVSSAHMAWGATGTEGNFPPLRDTRRQQGAVSAGAAGLVCVAVFRPVQPTAGPSLAPPGTGRTGRTDPRFSTRVEERSARSWSTSARRRAISSSGVEVVPAWVAGPFGIDEHELMPPDALFPDMARIMSSIDSGQIAKSSSGKTRPKRCGSIASTATATTAKPAITLRLRQDFSIALGLSPVMGPPNGGRHRELQQQRYRVVDRRARCLAVSQLAVDCLEGLEGSRRQLRPR